MSLNKIQSIVIEVLRDIQILSGRPWPGLGPNARPIGHLDGFDSLSGVEATVWVEEKLGCGNLAVDSLFVSEDGTRALTVKEVSERIADLLKSTGATA